MSSSQSCLLSISSRSFSRRLCFFVSLFSSLRPFISLNPVKVNVRSSPSVSCLLAKSFRSPGTAFVFPRMEMSEPMSNVHEHVWSRRGSGSGPSQVSWRNVLGNVHRHLFRLQRTERRKERSPILQGCILGVQVTQLIQSNRCKCMLVLRRPHHTHICA